MRIRQALFSLSDKHGAVEFAAGLQVHGVTLLSTGGTARMLRDAGLAVLDVADYTGFPEMLDGRVKTLHPKIHAGILARRDAGEHMQTLAQHAIATIDLVCVNLYPFAETVARADVTLAEAIENIDIGGPAMLRSAAKNYDGVAVVTDVNDYPALLAEMAANDGELSAATCFALARKAFVHTARYDAAIANWLTSLDSENRPGPFADRLQLAFDRVETLRYGENPHQRAAFYRDPTPAPGSLANYRQLQGKDLSYNNIADADAAWECVKTFSGPACVIVKHANPCGAAVADKLVTAYEKAFQTDPTSAFGGIIAFNGVVDQDVAAAMHARKHFVEVLLAPAFTDAARVLLGNKQNLRVLEVPLARHQHPLDLKRVGGGLLVQTPDQIDVLAGELRVVSKVAPDQAQLDDLLFAWRVARFVKSNAIVFCRNGMTLGIGAGQMSRVDSTRIAANKAKSADFDLRGSCVASDAFFPFRDGIDVLAAAGATAVMQPGGSLRDEEVIAAANENGLAMVFTGTRHFRH